MSRSYRFDAPDGQVYLLKIHNGSRSDIDAPVGVSVSRYSDGDPAISDASPLEVSDLASPVFVQMLDPRLATAKLMDYATVVGDGCEAARLMRDAVDECLIESFEDSQSEHPV